MSLLHAQYYLCHHFFNLGVIRFARAQERQSALLRPTLVELRARVDEDGQLGYLRHASSTQLIIRIINRGLDCRYERQNWSLAVSLVRLYSHDGTRVTIGPWLG